MNHQKINLSVISIATVILLAACGGGGGSTSAEIVAPTPTPAPVVTTPPAPTNAGIATSAPNPTYVSGSEELAALSYLNNARSTCGYGMLKQNILLDNAARNHADWVTYNSNPGHYESEGSQKFTGVTPANRIVAAGYDNSESNFVSQDESTYAGGTFGNDKAGFGVEGTRLLLNAPYHANSLLSGFREVGISLRNAIDSGAPDALTADKGRRVLQFNPAYRMTEGSQQAAIASDTVLTYPCQGSTNVKPALYSESPNPVPGRNLLSNPLGSSILVSVKDGNTLTITSATMINVSNSQSVTMRAPVTNANDPYAPCSIGCFQKNQAYIAADAPLTANTSYQVTLNGTNNGVVFSRDFTFTTGT